MASTSTVAPRPIPIGAPLQRTMPLHFQPAGGAPGAHGDAMDTSPALSNMSAPYSHSNTSTPMLGETTTNGIGSHPSGAAAAAQQPKVVQTAFIHKLYNMLEDQSIQHLITWSSSNDSFLISPSAEFSKVLATYFKHTNVSSFVRQLNMYGFHKVSDVFHSGAPESPLWEFKHGAGNFRRGDFAGLKEIKRRASRHTLIHRDSFPVVPKPPPVPMGPPGEINQDTPESRLNMVENTLYDLHSRLARTEESNTLLSSKCQTLSANLLRAYQYNHDLTNVLLSLIADPEKPLHRDVHNIQMDIVRQLDALRSQENMQQSQPQPRPQPPPPPPPPEVCGRRASFAQPHFDNGPPMSPFQLAQDEPRRGSLFTTPRQGFFRPPLPHRNTGELPRRPELGTIRGATPPPLSHPATVIDPPISPSATDHIHVHRASAASPPAYLSRRHTSADIRNHGWLSAVTSNEHLPLPAQQHSPFASGNSSGNWPSSPHRTPNSSVPPPTNAGEQQLRDSLARYQLDSRGPSGQHGTPAAHVHSQSHGSRHSTPPGPTTHIHEPVNGTSSSGHHSTHSGSSVNNADSGPGWTFAGARLPFKDVFASGPPTRRGSVAHLLNPADTAERDDEEDIAPEDLRKRKRLG